MRQRVVFALGIALFGAATSLAWAHSTGHESRTPAQCQRLPTPERNACLACVTRERAHHYHPDYPAGARCRPDNGRP